MAKPNKLGAPKKVSFKKQGNPKTVQKNQKAAGISMPKKPGA